MSEKPQLDIRSFDVADTEQVIALWQATGLTRPWNDPRKDIERKLTVQPELFLIGLSGGELVASAMGGYDGHRGWVNYLAVAPECRGRGYGRQIMDHLEERLIALGCPKLNLQVRGGNDTAIKFYETAGYARDDVVSFGKRLIPDD